MTYIRGLVVSKLKQIEQTDNPKEQIKLLDHILKFEAVETQLIVLIEEHQDMVHLLIEQKKIAYTASMNANALQKENDELVKRIIELRK